MDRSRMLPTSTDLLSPQGGDQGFVSPGDHLLSPLGDHQGLLSLGKPGLSLQVKQNDRTYTFCQLQAFDRKCSYKLDLRGVFLCKSSGN